ncbi:unnamed protein product, partial [Chrysoparadoxa australica]
MEILAVSRETKSVSISKVTSRQKCESLLQGQEVHTVDHAARGPFTVGDEYVPFKWPEGMNEAKATPQALAHIKRLLPLPSESDSEWLNCSGISDLLTVQAGQAGFPITAKGTSDVALCRKADVEVSPSWGLHLLFELKKPDNMKPGAVFQALAQLVTANIHSNHKPVVVLTDLGTYWKLLWRSSENMIKVWKVQGQDAVAILKQMLGNEKMRYD